VARATTTWLVPPSPVASGLLASPCRAVDTLVFVCQDLPAPIVINVRFKCYVKGITVFLHDRFYKYIIYFFFFERAPKCPFSMVSYFSTGHVYDSLVQYAVRQWRCIRGVTQKQRDFLDKSGFFFKFYNLMFVAFKIASFRIYTRRCHP